MTRICFIDTETTSLRPDRRAWEIGLITRAPGRPERESTWFVDLDDLDLGNADLMALNVGRFHERHPQNIVMISTVLPVRPEVEILREVEKITRGAHLVGAVVSFDAEVLAARMRAHGICPAWHYHLVDVEALAAGYLASAATQSDADSADWELPSPPWNSGELSQAVGVDPGDFERHTALGDASWARAIYDAIMTRPR